MPVYLYKNLNTGETFEIEQRITESALTKHPESGEPVKRLIQPVGIAFKGSGFYVTDSRSSSGRASGAASGGKAEGGTPAAGADGAGASAGAGGSGDAAGKGAAADGGATKAEGGAKPSSGSSKKD